MVRSSCNGPERRAVTSTGYTLLQGLQASKPEACLPQGTGLWILLISVISGGKKALALDQRQTVQWGVIVPESPGRLVCKALCGEGAGSVEMVSAAMGQIKRQREDCNL